MKKGYLILSPFMVNCYRFSFTLSLSLSMKLGFRNHHSQEVLIERRFVLGFCWKENSYEILGNMKKDPASLMLSTVTKKLHELGYVLKVPGLYNGSSLKSFDDSEPYITNNKLTNGARVPENNLLRSFCADKEKATNVAKIKVVVRKRPLNKKEIAKKEEDIITIDRNSNSLTVHETKLKVDLTEYVEKHEFLFDAVMSEDISNDEIYSETVEPIVPIIFQRTKATCFAYGQTGSGKTYTMQPLPLKASQYIFQINEPHLWESRISIVSVSLRFMEGKFLISLMIGKSFA